MEKDCVTTGLSPPFFCHILFSEILALIYSVPIYYTLDSMLGAKGIKR